MNWIQSKNLRAFENIFSTEAKKADRVVSLAPKKEPFTYGFGEIGVGENIVIYTGVVGRDQSYVFRSECLPSIKCSASQYGKRHNAKFKVSFKKPWEIVEIIRER